MRSRTQDPGTRNVPTGQVAAALAAAAGSRGERKKWRVFDMLACGYSVRDIAALLGKKEKDVRALVARSSRG